MENMFKRFAFLFCFLFLIGLTSAVPPITTTQSFAEGYILDAPFPTHWKLNTDYHLPVYIKNISNGNRIYGTDANCVMRIFAQNGSSLIYLNAVTHSLHYDFEISGDNFSTEGIYFYSVNCNSTYLGGYFSGQVEITESGIEITESRSILIIGLMGILSLFFFLSLFVLFSVENYIARFVSYWVSHTMILIITFIGWQIGVEGLLKETALTGCFRIMFWVFTIAFFPMLILSVVWIVYIHLFNEHVKKLVEKGEDMETAFAITKKKKGGLF